MDRQWIEAGFFIVSEGDSPENGKGLLPNRIVTVSTCLVRTYPDSWALPWVKSDPDTLQGLQRSMELDNAQFAEMRSWVDRAMNGGDFGWPNVFISREAAEEFRGRFLHAIAGLRLVGLSLTRNVGTDFVRQEEPEKGAGAGGVWTKVSRWVPLGSSGILLGFDVLGAEVGGSFHTFSCNGLERDFTEVLRVSFNQHGLIDDYPKCVEAAQYVNREDVGAEPVNWYPFRIDQY